MSNSPSLRNLENSQDVPQNYQHSVVESRNSSRQGTQTSPEFINLAAGGERFLQSVADRLMQIERMYSVSIGELLEELQTFAKTLQQEEHGSSNQQLLKMSASLASELQSKLRGSANSQGTPRDARQASVAHTESHGTEHYRGADTRSASACSLESAAAVSSQATVQKPSSRAPKGSVNAQAAKKSVNAQAAKKSVNVREAKRSVNLFLVGSTGNGMSATGNSILGRSVYPVNSSMSSAARRATCNSLQDSIVVQDVTVNVIEGFRVCDSSDSDQGFLERIMNSVEESLGSCHYTFSAILFVMKFGVRFTKQEVETVNLIKSILGKNVIKDCGICVITHGDNFVHAVAEAAEDGETLTFDSWCKDQSGDVKTLFEECSFRCVLFDNKTKDEKKRIKQRYELLKLVNPKGRYTKEKYLEAEDGRKKLRLMTLLPQFEKETSDLIDDIEKRIQAADEEMIDDPDLYTTVMQSLLEQLQAKKDFLQELGDNSSTIKQIWCQISVLESSITFKIATKAVIDKSRIFAAAQMQQMNSFR